MKVLYGVCSWGFGHATRSLPIIRKLKEEGNHLTIISSGETLDLLKKEVGEAVFIDIPDYPVIISEESTKLFAKGLIYGSLSMWRLEKNLRRISKLVEREKFDIIISDGRYDTYSRRIPSFFISHQVRIKNPFDLRLLEIESELFNLFFMKRFKAFIVPDFEGEENLSGDLSHNLELIDESKLCYVGPLSDFKKGEEHEDIDVLISISGPEPYRSDFERKIMDQIDGVKGKIVVTLGKIKEKGRKLSSDVTVYGYLSREEREEVMNRSKLIVSRSGYSTIMDLAVLNKKALLVPTPGQVEQEYLARYHMERGTFYSVKQRDMDLSRDIEKAKKASGIKVNWNVNKTVEKVFDVIFA